jgi:hypothetical protein
MIELTKKKPLKYSLDGRDKCIQPIAKYNSDEVYRACDQNAG